MDNDMRDKQAPIPDNLENFLSIDQQMALRKVENFGWELKFVRRPAFKPTVPIIYNEDTQKYAVLEEDGSINTEPDIVIR